MRAGMRRQSSASSSDRPIVGRLPSGVAEGRRAPRRRPLEAPPALGAQEKPVPDRVPAGEAHAPDATREAVAPPGLPVPDNPCRRVGGRVPGAHDMGPPLLADPDPLRPVELASRRPRRSRSQPAVDVATQAGRRCEVGAVDALRRRLEEADLQRLRRGRGGADEGAGGRGRQQRYMPSPEHQTTDATTCPAGRQATRGLIPRSTRGRMRHLARLGRFRRRRISRNQPSTDRTRRGARRPAPTPSSSLTLAGSLAHGR
jgi:hypothetical protein